MWLDARRQQKLVRYEPDDFVVRWQVDINVPAEEGAIVRGRDCVTVGRILCDELRRYETIECGESVWEAADADSSGLEAAWSSLLDEEGDFRDDEFEGIADPVVYVYRFQLHAEFVDWRMATADAFCRMFGSDAVILAQYHTTWFSEAEFELLGFHLLPPTQFPSPAGYPNIDREARFMARDNACRAEFGLRQYPKDAPEGRLDHDQWLEEQGPWKDLI